MDDDFDIEAMLEAPYEKEKAVNKSRNGKDDDSGNSEEEYRKHKKSKKKHSRSRSRSPKHSRSRRSRSRSPERRRRRSRSKSRDRNRPKRRDSSRDRDRDRIPRRRRSKSRSKSPRRGRRERSKSPDVKETDASGRPLLLSERKDRQPYYISTMSEKRGGGRHVQVISLLSDRERELEDENVSQDERDSRTVFVMQLARNVTIRDIEEFFSKVGQVRDVRLISDKNSRRSKGIGYVEFTDASSVPLAINLSGQRLLGVPIMCQPTMAEKNRVAAAAAAFSKPSGPTRLYVGSLHYNISEQMLTAIFEPFGLLESVQLQYDSETKRSKGYGFVTYKEADSAKRAMDQLNGLEVAGRSMKVGHVTERSDGSMSFLDDEETEKGGIEMNAASRAALMQKLAATHAVGMNVPNAPMIPGLISQPILGQAALPSTALILSNMFDPSKEHDAEWDEDIKADTLEEVSKIGNIIHIHVDKSSPDGNVYMKCTTPEAAGLVVQTFNGRWFAGRTLKSALLPLSTYHGMFPQSLNASAPLH